jgi:hypothetical protein
VGTFAFRGEALLAESDHRGVSNVTEAYRTAGIWVEPHLEINRSKIAGLSNWLAASCLLLAAEVILWKPRPPAQLPVTAPRFRPP